MWLSTLALLGAIGSGNTLVGATNLYYNDKVAYQYEYSQLVPIDNKVAYLRLDSREFGSSRELLDYYNNVSYFNIVYDNQNYRLFNFRLNFNSSENVYEFACWGNGNYGLNLQFKLSLYGNTSVGNYDDISDVMDYYIRDEFQWTINLDQEWVNDNNYFELEFWFLPINETLYNYYTSTDGEKSEWYQNGYDVGYGIGYDKGNEDGREVGFQDGKDAGFQFGYSEGRRDTIEQGQVASVIFSGILSIGLLPINCFLMMLNFEVFGINIGALVSSLLTICVIIILIRTLFGGNGSKE